MMKIARKNSKNKKNDLRPSVSRAPPHRCSVTPASWTTAVAVAVARVLAECCAGNALGTENVKYIFEFF